MSVMKEQLHENNAIRVSVALCTYNGEHYISEQLQSILSQTRAVDEIVICDDISTDDTVNIVDAVMKWANIPIRLIVNERNLGCRANFQKAIDLCKGDIIFLSDQDDIWAPDKVERVLNWFESNDEKDVVFTNGTFIDEAGRSYAEGASLFSSFGMTVRAMKWFDKGYSLELFLKNNKATGATMAFRKKVFDEFHIDCSSHKDTPYHDAQICLHAIQCNSLGYIPDNLICYRIHEGQDCGVKSIFDPMKTDNIISPLNDYLILGQYLTDEKMIGKYRFLVERREWVLSRSFMSVLKHLKNYYHFYSGLGAMCFIWDMALCIKFSLVN